MPLKSTFKSLFVSSILFAFLKSNAQLPLNLKEGLVAYYSFNKSLADSSGNNNNGIVTGTVSYVKDVNGNDSSALQLGSGRITTTNFFDFQYADSFTVSFWFQITDNSNSGRLVSTECPEGNFRITSYGNGIYAFQFGSADYYLYDTVQLNTWYYMTYVYNRRNVKLYRNGVLKKAVINNSTGPFNYCSPFTIGAKASPGYDTWKGYIDELTIYNRPLDSDEVKQWYNYIPPSHSDTIDLHKGLIAYYPFTGNANDSSGNGNNGTPVGAILTTDRFGNQNSAYYFNGSSYISTSFLPPASTKSRTLTGWYKTNQNVGAILCYGINSGSCTYAGGRFMIDLSNTRLRLDGVCSAVTTNISYDTSWHHFAITYDSSFSSGTPEIEDVKLYVDGKRVTDNELYFGKTPLSTLTNSNLFIGRSADNNDGRYFNGSIDDIFIYNRALTENEIKALYRLKYGTLLPLNIIHSPGIEAAKIPT